MTHVNVTVNVDTTQGSTEVSCNRGIVKIGSDHACDVRLSDPAVARMHAVIEATTANEVHVIDLGDGVKLNGKRVPQKERLYPGDVIEIGHSAAKIKYVGAKDAPQSEPATVERRVEQAMCIEREGGYLHGTAWCGKAIGVSDRYIMGVDRYVKRVASKHPASRACPHCVAAIKDVLDEAAQPPEQRAKVA